MDCLDAPLTSTPVGKWACPSCPDVVFPPEVGPQPSSSRQASAVSQTCHTPTMSPTLNGSHSNFIHGFGAPVTRSSGKGKQRMVEDTHVMEEEEEEEDSDSDNSSSTESDDDVDDDETATFLGSAHGQQIARPKSTRRSTKRPSRVPQTSKRVPPQITYSKKRITIKAPKAPLKLRLRIPAKPGSEPPSPKKDAFEDVLTKEQADVSQTTLKKEDRDRFDKAKITTEVTYYLTFRIAD
jgi:hypothetical protein